MQYRLYLLDDYNHILSVEEFQAADDATAIVKACFRDHLRKELWCGSRKVKQGAWSSAVEHG